MLLACRPHNHCSLFLKGSLPSLLVSDSQLVKQEGIVNCQLLEVLVAITSTEVPGTHLNLDTDWTRFFALPVPHGCGKFLTSRRANNSNVSVIASSGEIGRNKNLRRLPSKPPSGHLDHK